MNKHQIKTATTKQNFTDAYLTLLRTKDISEITVQEIVDRAGYNRGTFYIHYRSIYDLHYQLKRTFIADAKTQIQTILTRQPTLDFDIFFKEIANIFIANEKYSIPLLTRDSKFPDDVKRTVKPVIKQYFPYPTENPAFDYLLEYHLSSVFATAKLWISRKRDLPIDELFDLLRQIVTRGVFTVLTQPRMI